MVSFEWVRYAYFFIRLERIGDNVFPCLPYNAGNSVSGSDIYLDDVTFTGCGIPNSPTITKSFSPNPIAVNGTSTLSFTLANSNSIELSRSNITDSLPSGLQVAATPSATTTCGGTPTWAPGAGRTILTFGRQPADNSRDKFVYGQCQYHGHSLRVLSERKRVYFIHKWWHQHGVNRKATAGLTVLKPPSMTKLFSPNPILAGGTSTLTFTIANPNQNDALSNIQFSDTFPTSPAQMQVAATPNATTSGCGSPTFAPNAGAVSISFTNGTIVAGGTCTVSVNVMVEALVVM